jgi:hypothetical protein
MLRICCNGLEADIHNAIRPCPRVSYPRQGRSFMRIFSAAMIRLKKLVAGLLILTALLGSAVAKTDVMIVFLEDGDWEKTNKEIKKWIPTGKKSLHHQSTDHEDCVDLLDRLKKGSVILTLRNPTAMGRVIHAYCILPSGSTMKWPADAPTPTSE